MDREERPFSDRYAPTAWSRVVGGYGQALNAVTPSRDYLPAAVPAFLAEMLARLSASYYGKEAEFAEDLWGTISGVRRERELSLDRAEIYSDSLFVEHPRYAPTEDNRARPTPVEAAVETIRRLRDARELDSVLSGVCRAAILGGSASYGRFFNVKGHCNGSSDLDFLLVVDSWPGLPKLLEGLSNFGPLSADSLAVTTGRAREFEDFLKQTDQLSAFSAKLALWSTREDPLLQECGQPGSYDLSIHVVTRDVLGDLLHESSPIITSEALKAESVILDYRESEPTRVDYQRAFNGRGLEITLNTDPHASSFVRETRGFVLSNDHEYFPGMFQNLILPAFDVRWGDADVRRLVESFRWKLIDRLRFEQQKRPNEFLRLSLAHTRSEVFAPHTMRAVDRSTMLA